MKLVVKSYKVLIALVASRLPRSSVDCTKDGNSAGNTHRLLAELY